jgi:hypothetical protein
MAKWTPCEGNEIMPLFFITSCSSLFALSLVLGFIANLQDCEIAVFQDCQVAKLLFTLLPCTLSLAPVFYC